MNETCRKDWKLSLSSKITFKFLISSVQGKSDFACLFNTDCSLNIFLFFILLFTFLRSITRYKTNYMLIHYLNLGACI